MRPTARTAVAARLALSIGLLGALAAPQAAAAPATPGGRVPLRVATYNIHAGIGTDGVYDLERQAETIAALDADAVALQEVDVHWDSRSRYEDTARLLAERLGMHVYFAPIYDEDPAEPGAPRRRYGTAVLTEHRVVRAENHEITRLSTQDPDAQPAPAPGFAEVVLRVRGVPVHLYDTHLDYRPDPAVRARQVAETREIMAEDCAPDGRCPAQVLLGDLNAAPDAPELAPLWRELDLADPHAPTYPADAPVKQLDHIAVSPRQVTVRDVRVVDTQASDHRPVVADLLLRRR